MNTLQLCGSIFMSMGFILTYGLAYGRIGILYGGYLGGGCAYILVVYPIFIPLFIYIVIAYSIKSIFLIYRYRNGLIFITNNYVRLLFGKRLYIFFFL